MTTTKTDTLAAMMLKIAQLEADNAALKAQSKVKGLTMKVSEKGALSVYGMGRFPTTLYPNQWERLLAEAETIKTFIAAHVSEFSSKADAKAETAATPTSSVTGDSATAPKPTLKIDMTTGKAILPSGNAL